MFIKTMSGDRIINLNTVMSLDKVELREDVCEDFEESDNFPKGCKYAIVATYDKGSYILGGYETEERIYEVFRELESYISKPWFIETTSNGAKTRSNHYERIYQLPIK